MKIRPLLIVVFFATLAINNHSAGQSVTAGGTQTGENPEQQPTRRPQPTQPPQASASQPELMSISLTASTRAPENTRTARDENLPETGSTLPLLTVIGAGVLIGGLFSACKTRPSKVR